ncbi:MAG: SOS response-associated peptidase [Hyphomicrobium sp.]|nr:SOS response-associated peptidase [Hyphomicrobium sp.]
MCNLYSVTKGQQAIRDTYRAMVDRTGNMPPLPGVFPDQRAPVVRNGPNGRELAMLRWGFPSPPGVLGGRPVTNIRNTASSYWRAWMRPEHRCLVIATSFCEYASGKPAVPHWFALGQDRPLFAFAGLWRPWSGVRGTKAEAAEGRHELFAFLTCEPNAEVAPIHPKAMPVILTTPDECAAWLSAPVPDALQLQRPLADGLLSVVATGAKQDGGDVILAGQDLHL